MSSSLAWMNKSSTSTVKWQHVGRNRCLSLTASTVKRKDYTVHNEKTVTWQCVYLWRGRLNLSATNRTWKPKSVRISKINWKKDLKLRARMGNVKPSLLTQAWIAIGISFPALLSHNAKSKSDSWIQKRILRFFIKIQSVAFPLVIIKLPQTLIESCSFH